MSEFPSGIEQARRDFMRADPLLYDYIEARIKERVWDEAGDLASGASDQYAASNRCYGQSGRFAVRAQGWRNDYPGPAKGTS